MVHHRERAAGLPAQMITLLDHFEGLPFDVVLLEGVRSVERQAALYAQGRTVFGNIVTHAKPEQSPHCHAGAFDAMPLIGGQLLWSGPEVTAKLAVMGAEAQALGLVWGGAWQNFKDMDHFALPDADWKALPLVS